MPTTIAYAILLCNPQTASGLCPARLRGACQEHSPGIGLATAAAFTLPNVESVGWLFESRRGREGKDHVELSSLYEHAWASSRGEYIVTDDESFDANIEEGAAEQQERMGRYRTRTRRAMAVAMAIQAR